MAEDEDGVRDTAPIDSNQSSKAFSFRQIETREGQGSRGYAEQSALLFEQAMAQTRMAICLSDPWTEDQPIVFANRAFQELTGYDESEVLGRNCRFLQGPGTDRRQVARIREAIENTEVAVVEILNYRKNGESFWNALHVGPIYDDDGKLLYIFGSQWDVTEVHAARAEQQQEKLLARELSHRLKNMFSVINAVVSMAGRGSPERTALAEEISGRILALGRAHEATLESASRIEPSDLRPLLREILSAYDMRGQIEMSGEGVLLDSNIISMLALTIHELTINSLRHGALSVPAGHVDLGWKVSRDQETDQNMLALRWSERDGPSVSAPATQTGVGGKIIDTLIEAAEGRVRRDWRPEGLRVDVHIPLSRT